MSKNVQAIEPYLHPYGGKKSHFYFFAPQVNACGGI